MDIVLFGRFLMMAGSVIMSALLCVAMRMTRDYRIMWLEIMSAIVFLCQAFTVSVAIATKSPVGTNFVYFVVFNGGIHMTIALVATVIVWRLRK